RIDNHQIVRCRPNGRGDIIRTGTGDKVKLLLVTRTEPLCPQLHLRSRFLPAGIQYRPSFANGVRDLKEQRALTDTRLAGDQNDTAWQYSPAEHKVEIVKIGIHALGRRFHV